MDRIRIRGGRPLSGEIEIGGAKNAALPLMAAGMLTEDRLVLSNVPRLADIQTMGGAAVPARHHGRAVGKDRRTPLAGRTDQQHRGALRHRPQDARLRAWCWDRCWPASVRPGCPCPAAAPSAPAPSICT